MPDDQHTPQYRFERAVHATAPKPGHHLATAAFQLDDRSVILSVIEGPENDALGFSGMATDFDRTRLLRFGIRGPLLERLCELPHSPAEQTQRQVFRHPKGEDPSPIGVDGARVVFSSLRAANRADADSAAVAYMLPDGGQVRAALTGYQRGWYWGHVTVGIAVAIWVLRADPVDGQHVTLSVEQVASNDGRFEVSGAIAYRDSIMSTSSAPTSATVNPQVTNGHRLTQALATEPLVVAR
jgi:hypothetical protein